MPIPVQFKERGAPSCDLLCACELVSGDSGVHMWSPDTDLSRHMAHRTSIIFVASLVGWDVPVKGVDL